MCVCVRERVCVCVYVRIAGAQDIVLVVFFNSLISEGLVNFKLRWFCYGFVKVIVILIVI